MVLSMDRWVGRVAVVTGASSGTGAAIAEKLVNEGLKVAALARRKNRLDELATKLSGKKGKLYPVTADVTKEEDILNAFKWIKENLGPIHILVNSAGYLSPECIFNGNIETWKHTIQVNVIGLCIVTREAVKDMRANKVDGHIIYINSVGGEQIGVPGLGIYPPTKFAIRALAETLRLELNALKSKIKITNLNPLLIDTEMVPSFINKAKCREEGTIIEPEQIADGVVYALSTPPHVQIQHLTIRPIFDIDVKKVFGDAIAQKSLVL